MLAETNPYSAPQSFHGAIPRAQFAVRDRNRFPLILVWQALRKGAIAGLIASLAMLFVFGLKLGEQAPGELPNLLVICAWFIAATSALGLFWGLNHAVIVWCLARWPTEMRN